MTGQLAALPGKRSELTSILLRASKIVATLPGCRAYIVSEDMQDESVVWIFEIWDAKEMHDASLREEQARALISQARPILAGIPSGSELRVLGGLGVPL